MKVRSLTSRALGTKLVAFILALAVAAPQLAEARVQPTTGRDSFTEEQ